MDLCNETQKLDPKDKLIASPDERLNKYLEFTVEIDKMTKILRRTVLTDKSRRENDAEHSWHISVMAMLFSEYAVKKVDLKNAVLMCVVHDLVEIYAGDTFAFDKAGRIGKRKREEKAADKLFSMLPEDMGAYIRSLWDEFDQMETNDSKYANCMDRLQPFIHNSITEGFTWVEGKVTRSMVEERMAVVREFMPEVYKWVEANIDNAVDNKWIDE